MAHDPAGSGPQAAAPPSRFLGMAVAGVLLTAAIVGWLGVQWSRTTSELRSTEASVKSARASLRERRQDLKNVIAERDEALARQRAAVAAGEAARSNRDDAGPKPAPFEKPGMPSNRSVAAAAAFMAPPKGATEEPPLPTATRRAAPKTPVDVPDDTEDDDSPAPPADIPGTAENVKSSGPRVVEGVAGRLKGVKGKPVVVVEGLAGPLPPDAIAVSRQRGAGGIVPSEVVFKKDPTAGELRISGKQVAKISQKKATLTLELPASSGESQWLLDYLVLELRLRADGPATYVALGEPSSAMLDVHAVEAGGRVADEKAAIDRQSRYELFSDDDAKARLTRLLEAYPELYESLEFSPDELMSVPGKASKNGKSNPAFTLVDTDGIGVQLRRAQVKPVNYQWSAFVFPLQYGLLNEKYKGTTVFTEELMSEIPRALNAEIESTYSLRYRGALERAGLRDKESLEKAENFPVDSLRGRRVRLTLKKPGVEGGFVVVDSLGSAPPSSLPGAP